MEDLLEGLVLKSVDCFVSIRNIDFVHESEFESEDVHACMDVPTYSFMVRCAQIIREVRDRLNLYGTQAVLVEANIERVVIVLVQLDVDGISGQSRVRGTVLGIECVPAEYFSWEAQGVYQSVCIYTQSESERYVRLYAIESNKSFYLVHSALTGSPGSRRRMRK